jgi:hypothetical protein
MMRMLVTIVAALLVLAGTAAAQDARIEKGKEGKGNAKGPLDAGGATLSAGEIRQWLVDPKGMAAKMNAERKPPMKAFTNLPADELDALVAYVQSLKKK